MASKIWIDLDGDPLDAVHRIRRLLAVSPIRNEPLSVLCSVKLVIDQFFKVKRGDMKRLPNWNTMCCLKCKSEDASAKYCKEIEVDHEVYTDVMQRTCKFCGYVWYELPWCSDDKQEGGLNG